MITGESNYEILATTYVKLNPNARRLLLNDSLIIIYITVNYISNRNLTTTYYEIYVSY